jgi:hypothetical protein
MSGGDTWPFFLLFRRTMGARGHGFLAWTCLLFRVVFFRRSLYKLASESRLDRRLASDLSFPQKTPLPSYVTRTTGGPRCTQQVLQYTGRLRSGLKGTSHSVPQSAQIAVYIVTGSRCDAYFPSHSSISVFVKA